MSAYTRNISEILRCTPNDADMVEDIKRKEVFHCTLEWQTEAQFRKRARQAYAMLKANRAEFKEYRPQVKQVLGGNPAGELRSAQR